MNDKWLVLVMFGSLASCGWETYDTNDSTPNRCLAGDSGWEMRDGACRDVQPPQLKGDIQPSTKNLETALKSPDARLVVTMQFDEALQLATIPWGEFQLADSADSFKSDVNIEESIKESAAKKLQIVFDLEKRESSETPGKLTFTYPTLTDPSGNEFASGSTHL